MRLRSNLERSSSMNAVNKNQTRVSRTSRVAVSSESRHDEGNVELIKYQNLLNNSWRKHHHAAAPPVSHQPLISSTLISNTSTLSSQSMATLSRSSSINKNDGRPAFKLSTKIQYDDRSLYSNVINLLF